VSAEDALLAIADQGLVDAPVVWGGIPNIDGPYDSQADGFDGRALHQPRVAVEPLDRSVA
jgi:hypothetical protein